MQEVNRRRTESHFTILSAARESFDFKAFVRGGRGEERGTGDARRDESGKVGRRIFRK